MVLILVYCQGATGMQGDWVSSSEQVAITHHAKGPLHMPVYMQHINTSSGAT